MKISLLSILAFAALALAAPQITERGIEYTDGLEKRVRSCPSCYMRSGR